MTLETNILKYIDQLTSPMIAGSSWSPVTSDPLWSHLSPTYQVTKVNGEYTLVSLTNGSLFTTPAATVRELYKDIISIKELTWIQHPTSVSY